MLTPQENAHTMGNVKTNTRPFASRLITHKCTSAVTHKHKYRTIRFTSKAKLCDNENSNGHAVHTYVQEHTHTHTQKLRVLTERNPAKGLADVPSTYIK